MTIAELHAPTIVFVVLLNVVVLGGVTLALGKLVVGARRAKSVLRTRRFKADPAQVQAMAVETVHSLKGKIERVDGPVLVFSTGLSGYSWRGQTMEVTLFPNADGTCGVHVGGRRNPSLQVYDWGEADRIAARFFELLESKLLLADQIN